MPTRPKSARTRTESKPSSSEIQAPKGKLGIMIPGMGAVATTFVAGVEAVRKGIAKPIGSLTQMGTIRLGKRTDGARPRSRNSCRWPSLNDLVFTGWDIFEDNMYDAASNAGVLERDLLDQVKPFLTSIKPRKAVFDHNYVKKLDGPNVKKGKNKMDLAEQVRGDIREFKKTSGASRLVTIWCGSTETFIEQTAAHQSREGVREGVDCRTTRMIAPSMIYAYASLMEGVPFANGAPNLTVDIPAMQELSRENEAPICGKDFKTGQTLMKTILAPGFKARMLGLNGWFSTNILGNRDGEVLDDPGVVQDQGRVEAVGAGAHSAAGALPRALRQRSPQGSHQLLPAARRQQRRLGQHRYLRMAGLSHADQGRFPVPRLDSGGADRARSGAVPRPGAAQPELRGLGIQEWLSFYFKSPMSGARTLSRARSVHSADEAEEHAAAPEGRGADHAPGAGVLLSLEHKTLDRKALRRSRNGSQDCEDRRP